MKFLKQKKVVALLAAAVVAIAAVGAYAYWTNGGTGSGTQTAGTTADNIVIDNVTGWAGIKPGDTGLNAKSVSINLDNSANNFGSFVKNVVLNPSHFGTEADGTQDGIDTGVAGCLSADFTYTAAASPNINTTLPALDATNAFANVGTLALANTGVSQDDCKLASITLYLKIDNS